jgi:predicted deacylase
VAPRSEGGIWRIPLLTITGTAEGPTIVVVAGVHGDEYEGPESMANVYQQVTADQLIKGNLVMVPFFNIPAWESGTRSSPVDGLNLARVMPGNRNGTISERLGYYIVHKFMDHADIYLDIHSGGVQLNIVTSVSYYAVDDELGRITKAAALAFAAPTIMGRHNPPKLVYGSSSYTAYARGIAGIATEAFGSGRTTPSEIEAFTAGIINVMKHLGMMAGEPDTHRTTHHLVGDDKPGGRFSTSVSGYFKPSVRMLDRVTTGQRLGAILDFSGAVLEEFHAGRDGYITFLRGTPRTFVGDPVIGITDGERLK